MFVCVCVLCACACVCRSVFFATQSHIAAPPHLFFLQDDLLLQHFDGVEAAIRFMLGEQDLHKGLLEVCLVQTVQATTITAARTLP